MGRSSKAIVLAGLALGAAAMVLASTSSPPQKGAKKPMPTPKPKPQPNKSGQTMPEGSLAHALLEAVRAGTYEEPTWIEVSWPEAGVVLEVGAHALRAPLEPDESRLVRLPVSYRDTIAISDFLGWIPPSYEVSDTIWRAATMKLSPRPQGASPQMGSASVVLAYNDALDEQIPDDRWGELAADEGKDWVVSNRNVFVVQHAPAATTYGMRYLNGVPIQGHGPEELPPKHNDDHYDYSQVLRPVKRRARRMGTNELVDLAAVYAERGLRAAVLEPWLGGVA